MKKIILLSLALIIVQSCHKPTVNDKDYRIINVSRIINSQSKNFQVNEIGSNIELIPLETSDSILMGKILKMEVDSKYFYMLDHQQNSLFVFTNKGKFVSKITRIGKGPYEYIELSDFTILPDKNEILILDMAQKKLITYKINGTPVKEASLKTRAFSLCYYKNDVVILYTPYQLTLSGRDIVTWFNLRSGEAIKKQEINIKGLEVGGPFISPAGFNRINKQLFIKIPLNDTIFQVKNHFLRPYIYLNFGEEKIPTEIFNNLNKYHQKRNKYIEWGDYCATKDYFMFTVRHENKLKRAVIHKGTSKEVLLSSDGKGKPGLLINKTDLPIWPSYCNDSYFISYISASKLFDEDNIEKYLINTKNISQNDNYILIKCWFK